jgi:hypothetical protein
MISTEPARQIRGHQRNDYEKNQVSIDLETGGVGRVFHCALLGGAGH